MSLARWYRHSYHSPLSLRIVFGTIPRLPKWLHPPIAVVTAAIFFALLRAERRAVLRQAADARGIFLGDDIMDFMLTRFSRDLGNLMQLLDHLDGYALQTQRAITIPLIKAMLENE